MQRASAKLRRVLVLMAPVTILFASGASLAQESVEDNVRSASVVCLAGQPCVGTTGGAVSSMPAAAAATPVAAAPVAAPAPAAPAPTAAAAAPEAAAFDVAATYQMSCFACHGTGAAGAPKLGDSEAWTARMEKGMDAVMGNVINGVNVMPPKGMCMTCSSEDLRALVDYMVSQ